MTKPRNGGDVVAEGLVARGVRTVFSLSGGAHNWLIDALHRRGVNIVGSRHESSTVLQADGYARITGDVGVAMVIAQQGLSNTCGALGAVQDACSPVVVLVAIQPGLADPGLEEDVDELAAVRPFAKWVRTVRAPAQIPDFLEEACRRALSGRPGPVVLGIPAVLLAADNPALPAARTRPPRPVPSAASLAEAAKLISSARRPIIVAGSGAGFSDTQAALHKFAHEWGIPVFGDLLGRGLVGEDLDVGFSWPLAQPAAREADVVLLAGARLTQRFAFGRPPRFAASARFIQIDILAEELGRGRAIDVPIHADAGETLKALASALEADGYKGAPDRGWVRPLLKERLDRVDSLGREETPLHPYAMARALMDAMPDDVIVAGDGADALNWLHGVLRLKSPRSFMDQQPYGSMGISTPLAVGAAAAARDMAAATGDSPRPVVLFTGDGAFGFYLSELNSAEQANLPLIVMVSNDGGWGTERHAQAKAGMGKIVNCDFGFVRHDLVAQGFGCIGIRIEKASELPGALAIAFAEKKRPVVLDCITDQAAGAVRKADPLVQMVFYSDVVERNKDNAH